MRFCNDHHGITYFQYLTCYLKEPNYKWKYIPIFFIHQCFLNTYSRSRRHENPDGFDIYSVYRKRAIISRGLYFFYPIFTLAAAYIADNLFTKSGNSSFLKLKIRGL